MHGRRTHPALAAVILIAVLAASLAAGWFIAGQAADDRPVALGVQADPAEPPYDAGDPADGPPVAEAPAPPQPAAAVPAGQAPRAVPADASTLDDAPRPAPTTTSPPDAEPLPEPAPSPSPAPEPEPAPTPSPEPAPKPRPSPSPPSGPPEPSVTPYEPPPAIGIAAEALPPEGRAWSMLTAARRSAPSGSQERADLDWLVGFARSAGAPGRPEGRRATARRALRVNAWWFARRGSPDERVIARDPDGVILTYKRGHGFMVNPVATIGRWRGLNELWTPAQLAESVLPMLTERAHDGREWAALEYFDVPGDRSVVRAGVSGMGQARAVNLFAKAWSQTGDPRFLRSAERLLRAFQVPVNDGGVLASVPDPGGGPPGTWYPERAYPGRDAWTGAALNGFMVTIIELRRAAANLSSTPPATPAASEPTTPTATDTVSTSPGTEAVAQPDTAPSTPPPSAGDPAAVSALARDLADRAQRSLVRFLPLHDSGTWSYYGLLTPGKPWRTYLADLNYHCYHVALLRSLDALYPDDRLAVVANRWQKYVDDRRATCPAR